MLVVVSHGYTVWGPQCSTIERIQAVIFALITLAARASTGDTFWRGMSYGPVLAGIVTASLAALPCLLD
jgi:hypothetical protein